MVERNSVASNGWILEMSMFSSMYLRVVCDQRSSSALVGKIVDNVAALS